MYLKTFVPQPDSDHAELTDETHLNDALLLRLRLSLCVAASLRELTEPGAARVAEFFVPELGECDQKIRKEALAQLLSGEQDVGELDMSDFADGNPMYKGCCCDVAPGLYKLILGIAHAHAGIWWSAGDVLDLCVLLDTLSQVLRDHGIDENPVAAAEEGLRRHLNRAQNNGGHVRLSAS